MPDDDDLDCPGHDWQLVEVLADASGARLVHRCALCPAVSYEPSRSDGDQVGTLTGT